MKGKPISARPVDHVSVEHVKERHDVPSRPDRAPSHAGTRAGGGTCWHRRDKSQISHDVAADLFFLKNGQEDSLGLHINPSPILLRKLYGGLADLLREILMPVVPRAGGAHEERCRVCTSTAKGQC